MVSQIATGGSTDGRCFGIDRTKQQQWQLTVYGSLVGSQSRPWFVPRARNSHSSLTCDRQSQRNPPEHKTKAEDNGGMGQQSGLSPVVGSSSARNDLKVSAGASNPSCCSCSRQKMNCNADKHCNSTLEAWQGIARFTDRCFSK